MERIIYQSTIEQEQWAKINKMLKSIAESLDYVRMGWHKLSLTYSDTRQEYGIVFDDTDGESGEPIPYWIGRPQNMGEIYRKAMEIVKEILDNDDKRETNKWKS